ncbi:hypothetical protein PAXINDRAFT_18031 [Paxillus involutus ATCC 200175]|uniref:Uncharacterized protein n=1 Tax=Paxillus involutus ATCC 200175 TaxID=664439 RepID=A0A0C9SZT4_PAXIN|nr:hypothetical protein PAXINDRAFT_18031 [Paxillus involutus ATCC 200175]
MLNDPNLQPNAAVNRWVQGILLFDFTLVHVPATQFKGPDALSRKELEEGEEPPGEYDDSWVDSIALYLGTPQRQYSNNALKKVSQPYHPYDLPSALLSVAQQEEVLSLYEQELRLWCNVFEDIPNSARICIDFHEHLRFQEAVVPHASTSREYEPQISPFLQGGDSDHWRDSTPDPFSSNTIAPAAVTDEPVPSSATDAEHTSSIPISPTNQMETTPSSPQPFIPSYPDFLDFMETTPESFIEEYFIGSPEPTDSDLPRPC